MKNYFPFTDYDFYAYLTSGGLFLAVLDFVLNESYYLLLSDWSFAQIAVVVASSYVIGHLVAMLAQATLETFLMAKVFNKPMQLQLRLASPNWIERLLGMAVGRYYSPLTEANCKQLLNANADQLSRPVEEITDCEDVFMLGFSNSFKSNSVRQRIDDFRNQYGFCRNIAFVALVAAGLFIWKSWQLCSLVELQLAILAFLVFVGMFVRYVKFLSSFQAEVIRSVRG